MGSTNTQMPPTMSISRASTVAKMGRPMKKLTMAVLPPVGCGSASVREAGPGLWLLLAVRLRRLPHLEVFLAGGRARLGFKRYVEPGRLRLDDNPGPDHLEPLDDHALAGLEARLDDAKAIVGEGRPDRDDGHLSL